MQFCISGTWYIRSGTEGRPGRLEPILDFTERHSFRLNSPKYDRTTLNNEHIPTYKSSEPDPADIIIIKL